MFIKQYVSGLLNSNMYIIEEDGYSVIIDPFVSEEIFGNMELVPSLVILTHEHFDHISGVNFIKEHYRIPVYASAACAENLKKPNRNLSRHFDAFCQMQSWISDYICSYSGDYSCSADITFSGGTEIDWRGHAIKLIEAPGHSAGSILIYVDEKFLFAGDSIFRDYPTGTRFTGGSTRDFEARTRPIIESFPRGTIVYPGHFDSFRIEERFLGKEQKNA